MEHYKGAEGSNSSVLGAGSDSTRAYGPTAFSQPIQRERQNYYQISHSERCKSPLAYGCFLALGNLLRADAHEKITAPVYEMQLT
jgi:hypothetical protein